MVAKLLAAPTRVRFHMEPGAHVNPACHIELRFDDARLVRPDEREHVFSDGAHYEDVLHAAQAAWLANMPNVMFEIAEYYGLYWRVESA